jgi:proteasome lid subunit RPN8/RPN11
VRLKRELLQFLLKAARSAHPREFAGVLRRRGDVIEEVLLVPTQSSERSALLSIHMLPIDPSVIGTVHSHPEPPPLPSEEDLFFFDRFGAVHLIIAYPYTEDSWAAFNHRGERIELEIEE